MPSLPQTSARDFSAKIDYNWQGVAALTSAIKILDRAEAAARGIKQSVAYKAALNLVDQRRGYVSRVMADVPADMEPISSTLRARVGLALSQSEDALKAVEAATVDTGLLDDLREAFTQTLQSAGRAVGEVAKTAGDAAGSAVGGILSGLGPIVVGVLILVLYLKFFWKD